MKEIRCKNCGGTIHLDEYKKYGNCNYCGTEYKINDTIDYNVNINLNDNAKEIFNSFNRNNGIRAAIIVFAIMFMIPCIMLVFSITADFSSTDIEKPINVNEEDFNRNYFNSEFESFFGEQPKYFVEIVLGKVITNNNEGERIISVYYQDVVAVSQSEIQTLLKSLENKEYFISLNYSSDGYVNGLVIED